MLGATDDEAIRRVPASTWETPHRADEQGLELESELNWPDGLRRIARG
jgi:hypothetical protein